ncbi:hypothetical protein AK830_g8359 [Neonectria ditissima]|uniref:Gfo/Idh/MocA-like oxidoreductase N-terminal domain-containing protein n=1 Tax=Neonectria ditissima TaxID=78410 RepID=A0A0P7BCR1_9HYPO|nr:hypothetical protein AK830_g8359 [Neonectria ditissima]
MAPSRRVGVGIVGAGEVFQVCHGPCLLLMSDRYKVESIFDISKQNATHCAAKFGIPTVAVNAEDVINNPSVDVVFVLTSDDSHESVAISAVQAGKFVMVEKPLTLSVASAERIIAAEKAVSSSPRVFVGYMRRYAPTYVRAFKREVASIPRILYARVRDFSGPNAKFVNESGTFPVKNVDFPSTAEAERDARLDVLYRETFPGLEITDERKKMCRFLGSLGSHDISLMRETLGFPEAVVGVTANEPFYSALFAYKNKDETPFSVTYESGIDEVPVFDAHLAVYGAKKRVTIKYASPYVKGLPITVEVEELNEAGENEKREILSSYEDAYTAELKELYESIVEGKPIKTTAEDALQDLRLYSMMYTRKEAF